MRNTDVDVLIIGAGPAGVSTALHLLELDPAWAGRVLVLEKASHPRPKLCGGGVTRLGLEVLDSLGFPYPLPLPQAPVNEVQLVYQRRTVYVRGEPQFVVFERAALDHYLAEVARQRGVQLHENEPVLSLGRSPLGIEVRTDRASYTARVVVGADGSKGITRSWVKDRRRRGSRVARLLEVIHPVAAGGSLSNGRYARFDFSPVKNSLQGYYWDFPTCLGTRPAFNHGVYDARIAAASPRADLPGILAGHLAAGDEVPGDLRPQGHPIHWFSPRSTFSASHLVLVGDAAGAEPLFGEGIGPALAYGQVAAHSIANAFARGDFTFRSYRREVLGSSLGRYMLFRWLVAWWCYRLGRAPGYMHALWMFGDGLARVWPAPHPLGEDK